MQFSPDGTRLYAAGDEKLIQVWRLRDGENGVFERAHDESLRHMIGPGPLGAIHAMSISSDGRYIVAGGVGTFTGHAGFSTDGVMIPSSGWSQQSLEEAGTVTLFDTEKNQTYRIKTHPGYVLAAQVVSQPNLDSPYLITIGNDQEPTQCGKDLSIAKVPRSLRILRLPQGDQLFRWPILPDENFASPTLTAWATANANRVDDLRIAVAIPARNGRTGVDVFRPNVQQPIRFDDPHGVYVDRLGATSEVVFSSSRSLKIAGLNNARAPRRIDLRRNIDQNELIWTVASFRDKPLLAAITTRIRPRVQARSQHRLRLVDLNAQAIVGVGVDLGNIQNPVVATDPTGQFVAATADVSRGIQIYRVNDLRNGKDLAYQVLRPDFQPIQRATLVTDQDPKVLRVRMGNGNQPQDYDFNHGSLRPSESADWPAGEQQPIRFRQVQVENDVEFVALTPGGQNTKVKLATGFQPIGKQINCKLLEGQPLAAIAFVQREGEAQIQLSLFDPTTGIELRRLNGHQQFITGLNSPQITST